MSEKEKQDAAFIEKCKTIGINVGSKPVKKPKSKSIGEIINGISCPECGNPLGEHDVKVLGPIPVPKELGDQLFKAVRKEQLRQASLN